MPELSAAVEEPSPPDTRLPNRQSRGGQAPSGVRRMDHEQAAQIVAESHRILTGGRLRIERQRTIIERLEQLGVDVAKQRGLLIVDRKNALLKR